MDTTVGDKVGRMTDEEHFLYAMFFQMLNRHFIDNIIMIFFEKDVVSKDWIDGVLDTFEKQDIDSFSLERKDAEVSKTEREEHLKMVRNTLKQVTGDRRKAFVEIIKTSLLHEMGGEGMKQ